jgi:hypothetical protein
MVVGDWVLACSESISGPWTPRSQRMETAATPAAMLAPATGYANRDQPLREEPAEALAATVRVDSNPAPSPYVVSWTMTACTFRATRSWSATPRSARSAAPIMEKRDHWERSASSRVSRRASSSHSAPGSSSSNIAES